MAGTPVISEEERRRREAANRATATKGTAPAPGDSAALNPTAPPARQTTADGEGRPAPPAELPAFARQAEIDQRLAATGGEYEGDPYQLAYKQGDSYYDAQGNRYDYGSGAQLANKELAMYDAYQAERERLQGADENVNDVYRRADAEQQSIVDQYMAGATPGQTIDPAVDQIRGLADGAQITRDPRGQAAIGAAQGNQQALLDRVLSGPSTARAVAEQMAAEQRAQALSARGGAGAVQAAQAQAAANAPKLQQQAAISAIQEEQARTQVAAGLTGQQAQTALASEQNDIRIQEANQQAASNLINNIASLKGIEANITSQEKIALGQLQRDLAAWKTQNEAVWAQMAAEDRRAFIAQVSQTYGIDKNSATALALGRLNDDDVLGFYTATTQMLGQAAPKPAPGA